MTHALIRTWRSGETLRVVFLTGQLAYGGSERQVYLALKHLDSARFERHVVVFNPSNSMEYAEELGALGVKVWRIPADCTRMSSRFFYLVRLLVNIKPHVVHSWNVHDNPYAGLAGLFARVPRRVGSVRGSWESSGLGRIGPLARLLCLYAVPTMIVNAASIAHDLGIHGVDESRLVVVKNSLDDWAVAEPLSREAVLGDLGISSRHRMVIIVGNLRLVKNHRMFIEAIALVRRRHPDVRGVIVGSSLPTEPEVPELLKARVKELGLEEFIVFAGFRSDVPRLLFHADVACLTSDDEGSPNTVLEAMAAGRPVVATSVGGVSELVHHGVTGLLVRPGDPVAMADALCAVLSDEHLASRLGMAGRTRALTWHDPTRTAERLAAVYLDGIGGDSGVGARRDPSMALRNRMAGSETEKP